ncbi:MAG: hypothetical protein K2K06_06865, partial [Oscillospiraceae bacterium]|nr:hypothetical protein [Oscillospiraceae bacterium]
TEEDARLLISIHACNRNVPLASSRIMEQSSQSDTLKKHIDVPYIIDENDKSKVSSFRRASLRAKLEDLKELYRLEQMTIDEYEVLRSQIIK